MEDTVNNLRQYSLFDQQCPDDLGGAQLDVSFLHRTFCIAGLPLRDPKAMSFTRSDTRFSFAVNGQTVALPGNTNINVECPFGAKARLLLVWATTEAQRPERDANDRYLEIGRIKEWFQSIGTVFNSRNMAAVKEQLVRLSFSTFTMVLRDHARDVFRADRLVEAGAFPEGDLSLYGQSRFSEMRWPDGLLLTDKAMQRFRSDGIALPTARLAKIANNPMAIDVFLFLCYLLPGIPPGESELVPWRRLHGHFAGKGPVSKFRADYQQSVRAALDAYPEAKVDVTEEGLVLHHSDPAELRRAFVVVNKPVRASLNGSTSHRRRRAPKIDTLAQDDPMT